MKEFTSVNKIHNEIQIFLQLEGPMKLSQKKVIQLGKNGLFGMHVLYFSSHSDNAFFQNVHSVYLFRVLLFHQHSTKPTLGGVIDPIRSLDSEYETAVLVETFFGEYAHDVFDEEFSFFVAFVFFGVVGDAVFFDESKVEIEVFAIDFGFSLSDESEAAGESEGE